MPRAVALIAAAVAVAATAVSHDSTPAVAADDVEMALMSQAFTVAPGGGWTAAFTVSGDLGAAMPSVTTTTIPATEASVTASTVPASTIPVAEPVVEARVLARRRIADPAELTKVLDGSVTNVSSSVTVPVTLTTDGDQTTFSLAVTTTTSPDDQGALLLQRVGVYPVSVQLLVDGTPVATAHTLVDRVAEAPARGDEPMSVAVLADVADPGPSPSAALLAVGRTQLQAVAQTAAALGGTMTVRVPPVLVRDVATGDRGLSATLRAELGTAEVLAVPTPTLDPSSATAAGLQPTFSAALRDGEDVLGAALPTPPQRSAWIVDDPISTSGAAMLRDPLGFDLLVFDQEIYNQLDGGIGGFHDRSLSFGVDVGDQASLPGFVISANSHWLDGGQLDRAGLTATDGAVRLMSELVVARENFGADRRRSVVLALPSGAAPDAEVAGALRSFITETPGFALTRLGELPARTDRMMVPNRGPETVRLPANAGPDLSERARRVDLTRLAAASAGSMLAADQSQLERWNASLDALLSTDVSDRAADSELNRVSSESRAVYAEVEAPRPFTLTLTGRRSTLRLNLRNEGDRDLRVVVRANSPKLRFPDGDETVDLAPRAATEVLIPVEAQTNGTSAIGIRILTPFGDQTVQGPIVLTARINALSGLGQVVTGAALLVLVSWWYGHFRRRRRVRRALLGEVDNPVQPSPVGVSPDAAEAAVAPTDELSEFKGVAPPHVEAEEQPVVRSSGSPPAAEPP